ncbi:hypothetical protein PTSG_05661 [Salpingoeca rosetta]|uniref:Uncharacterized protein n=1 Tax=Salpingoeca rosetta (strain ATCC 50818 / BSB-021) TaxID=946362 RepID=F2UBV1_SALR5|nr:uncharacterized protein PTSG_05661 [Salpingoeca rosetta]EGD73967.1 hypothetical protein PTSG_05661 [Salpingoeca rosetta]|eukprot:XP_004993530.1 hypothetical protein PTSG_05661 [Salpingoeca rosetta]
MSLPIGVTECWVLVARHLLDGGDEKANEEEEERHRVSHHAKKDRLRSFFNLMMTCRLLYHDLPWALPKWYLRQVAMPANANIPAFSRHSVTPDFLFRTQWLDSFQEEVTTVQPQPQPQPQPQHADDDEPEQSTPAQRAGISSMPPAKLKAWLETRFLVYSWLGVTWDATFCMYLCDAVSDASSFSPSFRNDFARFGRLKFVTLQRLELWASRDPPQQQQQHLQPKQDDDDEDDDEDEDEEEQGAPSAHTSHVAVQQARSNVSSAATDGAAQHAEALADTRAEHSSLPVSPTPATSATTPATLASSAATTAAPILKPAVVSLVIQHATQDAITRLDHSLGVLGHPQVEFLEISATSRIPVLRLRNIDWLELRTSGPVDRLELTRVNRVSWNPASEQQTRIHGQFGGVRDVELLGFGESRLEHIDALEGVPCVTLNNCPRVTNLGPLKRAQTVKLYRSNASDLSAVSNVPEVHLVSLPNASMEALTLRSTRVWLKHLHSLTNTLNVPNATTIRVIDCHNLQRIVCGDGTGHDAVGHSRDGDSDGDVIGAGGVHLSLLRVRGCPRMKTLPSFEHADIVDIDIDLEGESLQRLCQRVDTIILNKPASLSHRIQQALHTLPPHVRVKICDFSTGLLANPLPPCVATLKCKMYSSSLDVHHYAPHVRHLSAVGMGHRRSLQGVDKLPHLKHVFAGLCTIFAKFDGCRAVSVVDCPGHITINAAEAVYAVHGEVRSLTNVANAELQNMDERTNPYSTRNVATCRVLESHINSLAPFAGVQRLLLEKCTFDSLDYMPARLTTLRLHNCRMKTRRHKWPDVVLVDRSREEMLTIIRRLMPASALRADGDDGHDVDAGYTVS